MPELLKVGETAQSSKKRSMASSSSMKLLFLRRLARTLKPPSPSSTSRSLSLCSFADRLEPSTTPHRLPLSHRPRSFCSRHSDPDAVEGPVAVDYRSLLQEDEFHKLADSTIEDLLEKFEEYGDSVDMDGFDIDYGNQVLTLKLGTLGTYVLNKQTPNRQIWLSSPVSGPARFDWDKDAQAWVYRRTKSPLRKVLETEVEQLCGQPITLS